MKKLNELSVEKLREKLNIINRVLLSVNKVSSALLKRKNEIEIALVLKEEENLYQIMDFLYPGKGSSWRDANDNIGQIISKKLNELNYKIIRL